jgi:site-specific recombinase XerD
MLIKEINSKLENGWNPTIEKESAKEFHILIDAIETYRRAKFSELEENSIRSYKSFLKRLIKHIKTKNEKMYCGAFDRRIASDFMLEIKQSVGIRTYNNYLLFYRQLFTWLKEYAYVNENPFETIHVVSKRHLKRIGIYSHADNLKNCLLIWKKRIRVIW